MIPSEIAAIADLIFPDWADLDPEDPEEASSFNGIIEGAYRIYNAGYRRSLASFEGRK